MKQNPMNDALAWLKEIGIDESMATSPISRFKTVPQATDKEVEQKSPNSLSVQTNLPTITTLTDLKNALQAFDKCSLKKTAMNLVFGDGNPKARVMLVGEAPGADEDRQGKPFVGMSGQLLTKIFSSIGLEREKDLYITNLIPWRPPGNRQPTPSEITLCLPFVKKHIELISPDILILVGGISCKSLLERSDSLTKLRGAWHDYKAGGKVIKAMPIYHPAYLLRSPSKKKDAWEDMRHIQRFLKEYSL